MAPQQQRPAQQQRRPMSNQEVEQYLGQQYARMLKDMPATIPSQHQQASEDIRDSLAMLGRFNQVALQIKRTARSQFFST